MIELKRRNGTCEIIEDYQLGECVRKIMPITDDQLIEKENLLKQGYIIGFNCVYFKKVTGNEEKKPYEE